MFRKSAGLVLAILLATCAAAFGQQSASSGIQGIVTDSSNAAVPGATVTVTNIGTNAERVTVTDAEGRFAVPNLLPARYSVRVEMQGFQTAEVKMIELRDGETARPTLTLAVGGVAEAVSVQAEAPLLQTQSASVGQTITEKQIEELPISGRSVLSAASLAAGVTPRNFARGTQYGRRNEYVTVEGGRDSSTNYAIDGVYVRSLRFNNMSLNPPLDAVQQVTLLRNSFSTEYGQGQAVVSMVTKSGSNSLTGSVYEFVRNDMFDSKNYFAASKTPYDRNQFGATAGGPIMRNKIFFFGGYEGLRTTQGTTLLATVANPTQLSGNFSALSTPIIDPLTGQPFPGNVIPASRFSNFAKILGPTIPGPNATGTTNYRIVKNFIDDADSVVLRSDQTLNSKHSLFERYLWADGSQINPGAFSATNLPQRGKNLAIGETWVMSPTWVNEIRVGYNYSYHRTNMVNFTEGRNWTSDLGLKNLNALNQPENYGRPAFTISGFSGNGDGGLSQGSTESLFSISNATSKVAGAHTIRFGLQYQYRDFDHLADVSPRGGFTFNGLYTGNATADFLLGYCSACNGTFGSAASTYHSPTFAPFFDDTWQVSRDLTLQLGLRWEYLAPWHEVNDGEAGFDAATGKIAYHKVPANIPSNLLPFVITTDNFYPAGILKKDLNNWAPRIGATYNLNSRTVVRSGFGIYYDNLNLNELQFTRLLAPFYGQYSIQPDKANPISADALFPDVSTLTSFPAPFSLDPNNRSPYVVQWNANVQRSLGRNYMAEIAYTGSRSHNLSKRYNINQANFGTSPLISRLPYPQWQSAILYSAAVGYANFEGISFRLEKRYSDGLFFSGSYQYSKNHDNGSGEIEANDTAFRTNLDADYSLSRYNQTHRSAFNFGYELPVGQGKRWLSDGGALAYVLGNWQVQGIVRIASGFPFTVSGTNVCQCGSFVPQRVNPSATGGTGELSDPGPQRWFDKTAFALPANGFQGTVGRNTLIGPGSSTTDIALTKRFPIQNMHVEFRGEIYNLFNHTNFGQPDSNISNGTAGVITSADDARNVQFAVRVVW